MTDVSVYETPINGLVLFRREPYEDHRGSLDRLFDLDMVRSLVPGFSVAQVNHTVTIGRGTVRGLHYQVSPFSDAKVITCLRGRVFDVAVDVRRGSSTFLNWHSIELVERDGISVVLPPGFAHGFQLLDDACELLYVHGERYSEEAEGALHAEDPLLDIVWPKAISVMSDRDREHPMIDEDWPGVVT